MKSQNNLFNALEFLDSENIQVEYDSGSYYLFYGLKFADLFPHADEYLGALKESEIVKKFSSGELQSYILDCKIKIDAIIQDALEPNNVEHLQNAHLVRFAQFLNY